jgi:hypothetical protein
VTNCDARRAASAVSLRHVCLAQRSPYYGGQPQPSVQVNQCNIRLQLRVTFPLPVRIEPRFQDHCQRLRRGLSDEPETSARLSRDMQSICPTDISLEWDVYTERGLSCSILHASPVGLAATERNHTRRSIATYSSPHSLAAQCQAYGRVKGRRFSQANDVHQRVT